MNKRGNILIGLSILPGMPILTFASIAVLRGTGYTSHTWAWMAAATLLGIAGCTGLVLASIPAGARTLVTVLIACGYLALGIAILGADLTYREQQALLPAHTMGEPFPLIQIILLIFMLAWPICAGIVALREMWAGG